MYTLWTTYRGEATDTERTTPAETEDAGGPGSQRDAESGALPPGRFDLLVDKGTLDAVAFAGGTVLEGYFAAVREGLQQNRGSLWVHFSDEPPEGPRGALLRAALPEMAWRVRATAVDEADALDSVVAGQVARAESAFEFLYYQYTATHNAPSL